MQAGPVELLGQALEMGRRRHQHRVGTGQRTHQVFVEEPTRMDQAAGGQRPQHAEQQPVDVLVGHRAVHLRAIQLRTERGLQRFHLARQLVQALADRTGLAGAAGGERTARRRARPAPAVRRPVWRPAPPAGGSRPVRRPRNRSPAAAALQRGRQVVSGQEHPLAGMPGAEQRRSEGHGVIEIQGPVAAFSRRKGGAPALRAGGSRRGQPCLRRTGRRCAAAAPPAAAGPGQSTQPCACAAFTRRRTSHSPANNTPIITYANNPL